MTRPSSSEGESSLSGTIKVYHVIAHHSTVGRPSLGDNFSVSAFLTGFTKEAEMRMVVLGAAVGTLLLGAIPASAVIVPMNHDITMVGTSIVRNVVRCACVRGCRTAM